ncbi:MAG TPA: anthranilate synthase component I [Candidatus Polarisedimenticolia bacterium]|nr:anthranilate synthase component I [Candidatus Polarisedimenticolia bacterium]
MRRQGYNFLPGELPALARRGNVVPLCREIGADLLTPVGAFLRVARGARYPFLLESIEGGESLARYSFLGRDPVSLVRRRAELPPAGANGDPLAPLRSAVAPFRPVRLPDLPRFAGGAVGFLSFDVTRLIERLPTAAPDDLGIPDILFGIYDTILAFDHLKQRIQIVSNIRTEEHGTRISRPALARRYRDARRRIEALESMLGRPLPRRRPLRGRPGRWRSNVSEARYRAAVRRAKEYIRAGDILQVVLSQRFERRAAARPFDVYRALRRINPSPYMYFLDFDDVALAGASPEMLVRVEGRRTRTRPIAGTRPRGRDEREDARMATELLADPKERAEHVMLVDLGRNDLGQVGRAGSVEVTRFMDLERYSHVMHLVSEVSGVLKPGRDAFDALIACFPAGTVSGAPKVRALEIIDELETSRRGPYAGAVGYVDFSGTLDSCITIRTVVMKNGVAHVQAGAGIVADSVPQREHRECLSKAGALIEAIEQAESEP